MVWSQFFFFFFGLSQSQVMLHYGISTNSCVVSASHVVLCVMMIVDLHGLLLYVHDGQVHHYCFTFHDFLVSVLEQQLS